jgi:hypothetical protein
MRISEPDYTVVTRPQGLDWLRLVVFQVTVISLIVLGLAPLAHVQAAMPVRLAVCALVALATALSISTRGGLRLFGKQAYWLSAWGQVVRYKPARIGFKLYGPRRMRPDSQLGSPVTMAIGALLVVAGWSVFTVFFATEAFWLTGPADEPARGAFHPLAAGLAAGCSLLIVVCDLGFYLAGFVILPRSGAGWARKTVNTAILAASAGYDELLKHAGWLALSWVPVHVWDALEGWWHQTWLAVVCIPLGCLYLWLYLQATGRLWWLAGKLLGKENAAAETLQDSLPIGARAAAG